jgi:hypothetical protein
MISLVTNCCVELFAIYKEVQSMFETGRLSVPEDVTLLFQDDNFGTIRRLPTAEESKRKGGAGVSHYSLPLKIECLKNAGVLSSPICRRSSQLQVDQHKFAGKSMLSYVERVTHN